MFVEMVVHKKDILLKCLELLELVIIELLDILRKMLTLYTNGKDDECSFV